jgi:hypothetical protein
MKLLAKLSLTLAVALSIGIPARSEGAIRGQLQAGVSKNMAKSFSVPVPPESATRGNHREVTRYAMGFYGDRSLEVATIVEEVFTGYARYTVRLQLVSGAEQSIAVIAPPGGLQPEMRDMTGDKVPNDVILTSRFGWPPTVLVNDGHDRFAVAILGGFPGLLGEGKASKAKCVQDAAALVSPRFKQGALADGGGLILPQLQRIRVAPIAQMVGKRSGHTSHSGRAPPPFVTKI